MKLIYHQTYGNHEYSPFDSEIVSLANGQNLLLVSPYIGLAYLKRITKIAKSWKLLTDFQEWIISHPNKLHRLEICDFIANNPDKVKHISDIHAKVLITDKSAFLGSANFTEKGLLERTEMSVSFSEIEKVNELKEWFNSLWETAMDYTRKQLFDFVKKNENVVQPKIVNLKSPFLYQKRKTALVPIDTFLKTEKDYEQDLIKAIKQTRKDKIWLNRYFDLLKDLLIEFKIDENSPVITMSVTKTSKMPVSIGQRYIVCPRHKRDALGLILPLEFRDIVKDYPRAEINESYFYRNNVPEALWVDFDSNVIFSDDTLLLDYWKDAVKTEVGRTTASGFRKSHNPFYYKAAMDLNYREKTFRLTTSTCHQHGYCQKRGWTLLASAMCRHQQQFGGDGILFGFSSYHHLFYLYSAAVPGWTFNEYPAFGNTCSLAVRLQRHFMTIAIILFFIIVGATGFIVLRTRFLKSVETMTFTNQYRNTYIDLVNKFYESYDQYYRQGNLDNEKYMWLTKNANKMQGILGQSGIIHYVAPFQKYSVPNYHLLINTLPKFREKLLHESEVNMVDDALLRKYGILEEVVNSERKELINPFKWFKQGFKELFSLPFYIINWFGIIPDKVLGKITSNIVFNILVGIGGLVTFLSGIVTIIQGKEATIQFIKTIFNK